MTLGMLDVTAVILEGLKGSASRYSVAHFMARISSDYKVVHGEFVISSAARNLNKIPRRYRSSE